MLEIAKGFYETPPLWINQQFGLPQFSMPDVALEKLAPLQLPTKLRLGHQMEYVFNHIISASSTYEIALQNLLIESGKVRLGELDFILRDPATNHYFHVELAYKFYILNPSISEPIYRLMGPNKRDMFFTKLDKLKEKQFPLLLHSSLEPYWNTLEINPQDIQQQCCFKAQLFQPYGETVSIRPLNKECIAGHWLSFDDFNSDNFRTSSFYIPQKIEWVMRPHHNVAWQSHYETLLDVNLRMVKEQAPMLWIKRPDGVLEKVFVVWW